MRSRWVTSIVAGLTLALGGVLFARPEAREQPRTRAERLRAERLPGALEALKAVHQPKLPPSPGDWLTRHDEQGQSLREYLRADRVRTTLLQSALYVVRIGPATPEQQHVFDLTREYLALHFQVPVHELPEIPADAIPATAQRKSPVTGEVQWNTGWILDQLLPPRRPKDGVALMALTAVDLWPGPGWNFVFGEASLSNRVGVWSIARHGDPAIRGPQVVLRRTLKVAAHEAGHMFSMEHCVAYQCLMNGSNYLPEADAQPIEPCPVCLAKLHEATGAELEKRFKEVRAFLEREGLTDEAELVRRSAAAYQDAR